MIVTAQLFLNELDLLEIKLNELKGEVDAHIVVESPLTFTGRYKPMVFAENAARFREFNIIYHVAHLTEFTPSPWDREYEQHRAVLDAVRGVNPEIAIWLDADEIPRAGTVERFRKSGHHTATLEMDMLLFFFNRIDTTLRWHNSKIGFFDKNAPHQPWRGQSHYPILDNAGWHCCYFGAGKELDLKMVSTSHTPEPGGENMRRLLAEGHLPGYERTIEYPIDGIPRFAREQMERYNRHFNLTP